MTRFGPAAGQVPSPDMSAAPGLSELFLQRCWGQRHRDARLGGVCVQRTGAGSGAGQCAESWDSRPPTLTVQLPLLGPCLPSQHSWMPLGLGVQESGQVGSRQWVALIAPAQNRHKAGSRCAGEMSMVELTSVSCLSVPHFDQVWSGMPIGLHQGEPGTQGGAYGPGQGRPCRLSSRAHTHCGSWSLQLSQGWTFRQGMPRDVALADMLSPITTSIIRGPHLCCSGQVHFRL